MLPLPFLRSTAWRPLLALLVVLLAGRNAARAQGWTGLATSNYAGTNGLYWNPSSIADSRHKFYINLAGADINFYNDYLELAMPYTPWQLVRGKVGDEYRDGSGNVLFKREYLREQVSDVAIHTWDLARAVGADEELDTELVEAVWTVFEPQKETLAASGLYAPPVPLPDDAPLQQRLLAVTGRDPR